MFASLLNWHGSAGVNSADTGAKNVGTECLESLVPAPLSRFSMSRSIQKITGRSVAEC